MNKRKREQSQNGAGLPKTIKLSIEPAQKDYFCGIFEILSRLKLKDLCAVGRTCVRLNQLAANQFQRKYSARVPESIKVHTNDAGNIVLDEKYPKCFVRCIPVVEILKFDKKHSAQMSHFQRSNWDGNLRKISFQYGEHLKRFPKSIKSVLNGVEILQFCNLPDNYQSEIVNDMLQYCTQLKELEVDNFVPDAEYEECPTLELPRLRGDSVKQYCELAAFLRKNPNISKLVWYFSKYPKTTVDVINVLYVVASLDSVRELYLQVTGKHINSNLICPELKILDGRDSFKRLEISTDDPEFVSSAANQNLRTLNGLHLRNINRNNTLMLNFSSQLKLLHLFHPNNIRTSSQDLQNLEIVCIDLYSSSWTGYTLFVAHSPKLKKLIMRVDLCCNAYFDIHSKLRSLNEMRGKLQNACKMVIYVVTTNRTYCADVFSTSNNDLVSLKSVKQSKTIFDSNHPFLGAILNE